MGTIVVGYVPKPEGEAALRRAVEEAKLRGAKLVVVNSHRGGREFDGEDAVEAEEQLEAVRGRARRAPVSSTRCASWSAASSPAEDLISIAEARSTPSSS